MSNRLLGIEKDLYEVVMDLWKADKTDAEIAEHINLNYRHPRNQRLISRRTINRVIWRARAAKDPRAIYHGNRNLSPTPREHVAYRKPKDSLFRRHYQDENEGMRAEEESLREFEEKSGVSLEELKTEFLP